MAGGPVRWWFHPPLGVAAFYAGIAGLFAAWLGLAPRASWRVGVLWCVPVLLTAPLFSQDAYSYLAQGTLVHLGIDPYTHTPAVLAQHGQGHVLNAVSPFWRHTTAPYGPLFLWIVSWFSGTSLVVGVLLIRALGMVGCALLAVFLPRLARGLGADPGRATWWVLLSPLVVLQLVAAAHNDLLMIGLLVAGVSLALERRVLAGIALCALAATIKLPAAVAIPFILMGVGSDRRTALRGLLVAAGVVVAVSVVSGLGFGWISSAVFSTPAKVRLAITPATALGWTVAQIVPVGARGLEAALGVAAFAGAALLAVVLLLRVRRHTMVRYLGIVLLAVALAGPAAWPWYLSWGLVLLAASPEAQAWRVLPVAIAAATLAVKADGILAFPLHTAPVFVVLYAAVALAVVVSRRRPKLAARRLRPVVES